MKPITPILSPEQRRAKNQYQLALTPAMFAAMFGIVVVSMLLNIFFNLMSIRVDSSDVFIPLMFGGFLLAHLWAVRKVKTAGFSLASQYTEVVTRIEAEPKLETVSWWCSRTLLASLGHILFLFLLSAMGWWLWHSQPTPVFQKAIGFAGFWLGLWAGGVAIIFFRSPQVRIDKETIVAFQTEIWRRKVRWSDVAQCEIRSVYNFMGQGPTRFFIFRSATGKVLLRLYPVSFQGLTPDEQAEIEREIKRRMIGEAAADD